ncbi:MAG: hypothetical protein K9K68_04025 [Methylococcaceae bacterium]|nr:hypothetical protein [Methylococcaceae bacterium]
MTLPRLISLFTGLFLGLSHPAMAEPSPSPGGASYNLTDYGSPLTTRVTMPPNWMPVQRSLNYQGRLDVHWFAGFQTDEEKIEISKAQAVSLGAPENFNLITAPDNCWGMFMNFGLIHLAKRSDLNITLAADSSQGSTFAPGFGLYRGWDRSQTSSRHGTLSFGYDNPLGTQGLTFVGDAYASNDASSVTQSFQNLEPGDYELFVTSRTNHSSDGAYTVKLETFPADSTTPTDAGDALCGLANNVGYDQIPPEPELCRWGQPVNFRSLKNQRYTWTCYGAGQSLNRAQCYTTANNHKHNQAPLVITPGHASILSGQKMTLILSGGSGKGRLKVTKGFASYGTTCQFRKTGHALVIKAQGQSGECRFRVTKGGDKAFNDVESPSLTVQVIK